MTSRQAHAGESALPLLKAEIRVESDVVSARRRARQIAALLGFDVQHQTRLATAVSEIARNAFNYAGGGSIEFLIEGRTSPQVLVIRVVDAGPGIAAARFDSGGPVQVRHGHGNGNHRRAAADGSVSRRNGAGSRHDGHDEEASAAQSAPVLTAKTLTGLLEELSHREPENALDELQQQNRELIAAAG